jgi:hypothetical protein
MQRIRSILLLLSLFTCLRSAAQDNNAYNIVWTTQSKNSSESMPCGGGDIGMNVWVENGELLIYFTRSGSFDEHNTLLKSGRIRVVLSPNPFTGKTFKQELHLQEGYVSVEGEHNGVTARINIWAEVFQPVAHIDISSNKKIDVKAGYENWRYKDRVLKNRENFANSWKWGAPKDNVMKADKVQYGSNTVMFLHHNDSTTIFDTTVFHQGMSSVKDQLYNPLRSLAFGGMFTGHNFEFDSIYEGVYVNTDFKGWRLKSKKPATRHELSVALHTEPDAYFGNWHQGLKPVLTELRSNKKIFKQAQQWWQEFWDRSFIRVGNNADTSNIGWQVGRNYQLFRYMLACNAMGEWPTKFNGGLLTVDPVFTDGNPELTPDYRAWGGGVHTAQNQRLVYFPMIKSGDWDMMQSQFKFYLRILKNAELRSKIYWNHGGACFTEQMENYGLPNFAEYGLKRPADFDKGVEYNAWLEYEWDTVLEFCLMMLEEQRYTGRDISDKIPFIESCLQFFDEHYQYLAKQRGIKSLDGDGKLVLFPGSGAETFKMANNSTSTIAALQTITQRLLALPSQYVTEERKAKWEALLKRIPPLNYTRFNGHVTIAPAKTWERINNTESPQLYTVFPWRIYGVGKRGLDTALNTWQYDTNVVKFRSHVGWKQDNIWAAGLGLKNEAWTLTSLKLQNSPRRFPAFWGPGFDWVPDHNWGGSGMIGLQDMLLQADDKRILLFPAWDKNRDVHFKLHAPYNTIVEAKLKAGKIEFINVTPRERSKDLEVFIAD